MRLGLGPSGIDLIRYLVRSNNNGCSFGYWEGEISLAVQQRMYVIQTSSKIPPYYYCRITAKASIATIALLVNTLVFKLRRKP